MMRSAPASESSAPVGKAPSATTAAAQIAASPRHGEFVMISAGGTDSVRSYVVFPERKTKAPVVVVIHEIYGLSTWIRSVADQLAAEGYIAIAPDLMTGKGVTDQTDSVLQRVGPAIIRALPVDEVQRRVSSVAQYGMNLPAAEKRYGVVGFCWGGQTVFQHAVASANVGAVVVYYGTSPATADASKIKAPVLGLYGENDARVNATIAPMDSAMKRLGKRYEQEIYAGAGHGFLRQQSGANGANLAAAEKAWPRTIAFFRETIGR
jgi:carboxymethylenebutenolidase